VETVEFFEATTDFISYGGGSNFFRSDDAESAFKRKIRGAVDSPSDQSEERAVKSPAILPNLGKLGTAENADGPRSGEALGNGRIHCQGRTTRAASQKFSVATAVFAK
jgi:hypothetical protein